MGLCARPRKTYHNRILEPFSAIVARNFEEWLEGRDFTLEQVNWLEWIQEYIATSLEFQIADFGYIPFAQRGGIAKAIELFGDELVDMLKDLTEKLVS